MRVRPLIILLIACSCDSVLLGPRDEEISVAENLLPPRALNDDWDVSTPSAENVDEELIANAVNFIHSRPDANIHSMLIVRNNKLIVESYYNGWNSSRRHDLRSSTKSFVSCLVGIAIDQGIIKSVDERVYDFFPEYESFANWDDRKRNIPIRHFIQMRTGLACDDWNSSSIGNQEIVYEQDDWIKFVLDLPVVTESGRSFSYCSGAPIVLSAIIANTSRISTEEFANLHLFSKLKIRNQQWNHMPTGRTGGQLHMYPRDMAKFGTLYLNGGTWKGQRIVSSDWVAESTQSTSEIGPTNVSGYGYGYLWWTRNFKVNETFIATYLARGNGGQLIFVVPTFDLVVVFTGGNYNEDSESLPLGLMTGKILPAMH
jgi:CubicO group peptidase (beta-lactamase class C family)